MNIANYLRTAVIALGLSVLRVNAGEFDYSYVPFNYKTIQAMIEHELQRQIDFPKTAKKTVISFRFAVDWKGKIANVHMFSHDEFGSESHVGISDQEFELLKHKVKIVIASIHIPQEKIDKQFDTMLVPSYTQKYIAICTLRPMVSVKLNSIIPEIK